MKQSAVSESADSTATSLLVRVKQRDPEAWERLTKLYGPVVYRWARVAGLQDNDAADIVQEAFSAVAQGIDGFRREQTTDSFRGWLWTITRNKICDYVRWLSARPGATGGSAAQQQLQQIPAEPPPQPPDDGVDTVAAVANRAVDLVRNDFESHTWQAFHETAIQNRRAADVADQLGMTVSAVYTAKSRVLRRIREELDGLL